MSELFGTVPGTVLHEGRVENTKGSVAVMKGLPTLKDVPVLVISTNEELAIAREVVSIA